MQLVRMITMMVGVRVRWWWCYWWSWWQLLQQQLNYLPNCGSRLIPTIPLHSLFDPTRPNTIPQLHVIFPAMFLYTPPLANSITLHLLNPVHSHSSFKTGHTAISYRRTSRIFFVANGTAKQYRLCGKISWFSLLIPDFPLLSQRSSLPQEKECYIYTHICTYDGN